VALPTGAITHAGLAMAEGFDAASLAVLPLPFTILATAPSLVGEPLCFLFASAFPSFVRDSTCYLFIAATTTLVREPLCFLFACTVSSCCLFSGTFPPILTGEKDIPHCYLL